MVTVLREDSVRQHHRLWDSPLGSSSLRHHLGSDDGRGNVRETEVQSKSLEKNRSATTRESGERTQARESKG